MQYFDFVYRKDVLTSKECNQLITEGNENLRKGTTASAAEKRNSNVNFLNLESKTGYLIQKIIDHLDNISKEHYKFNLTHIEEVQYSNYQTNMFYDWHVDTGGFNKYEMKRNLSASVFLSKKNDYTGGDFEFLFPTDISLDSKLTPTKPYQEQGTLLVFPSMMIHRVTKILSGERCSLVFWGKGNNGN